MSNHFYAFFHVYGIRTISADGYPIGALHRFDSAQERDAWVAGELYEGGNVHREGVDARLARKLLELDFKCADPWRIDAVLGRGASCEMSYWRKAATIDQLYSIYNRCDN